MFGDLLLGHCSLQLLTSYCLYYCTLELVLKFLGFFFYYMLENSKALKYTKGNSCIFLAKVLRDEKDGDVIQAPIVQRLVLKLLSSSRKVTFILGRPNVAGYLRFLNYVGKLL